MCINSCLFVLFIYMLSVLYFIIKIGLFVLKNIIEIFICFVQRFSVFYFNRNMILFMGVFWWMMVELNSIFFCFRFMVICFLYLGSQLLNMVWLFMNFLCFLKFLDWNLCSDCLYRFLLMIIRFVFLLVIMVVFWIQLVLIRVNFLKFCLVFVGRSFYINVYIYNVQVCMFFIYL